MLFNICISLQFIHFRKKNSLSGFHSIKDHCYFAHYALLMPNYAMYTFLFLYIYANATVNSHLEREKVLKSQPQLCQISDIASGLLV